MECKEVRSGQYWNLPTHLLTVIVDRSGDRPSEGDLDHKRNPTDLMDHVADSLGDDPVP